MMEVVLDRVCRLGLIHPGGKTASYSSSVSKSVSKREISV